MTRALALAAALFIAATSIAAQPGPPPPGPMPHGKWWRRAEVAKRLDLSRDQQSRLDDVFNVASNELIDAKADVKKLEVTLRAELDRTQLRRQEIQRIATQLSAARAKLFERELMLLVDMRGVLNEQQWSILHEFLEDRPRDGGRRPRPR